MDPIQLQRIFERLLGVYGPQQWWPAESPFEIMIGAILTQNTAWRNVEQALRQLRAVSLLEPQPLLELDPVALAEALRPCGYFNLKTRRLRTFCAEYRHAGGLSTLETLDTPALRAWLLAINGVGPETADDILLYAFERPVFVIDAYTRRIFSRLGLLASDEGYEVIRAAFERALPAEVDLFKDYHALLVTHAKSRCRTRPQCSDCPLSTTCLHFK